jgi:hypothetical protein
MNYLKSTFFALVAVVSLASLVSCNEYKSINSATKISQLSGNTFMYNLSKSLLSEIKTIASLAGKKADVKKINLITPIAQVLKTQEQISTFKNVLNTVYKVPVKKLDAGWGNLGTIKDLVMFVAKNGRSFSRINF